MDNGIFNYESIAWKILMDDDMDMGQILSYAEDSDDDPTSYMFELLINILMEMIFGMLMIDGGRVDGSGGFVDGSDGLVDGSGGLERGSGNVDGGEFKPKITCEKFINVIPILEEKLRKLSVLMNVHSYNVGECDGIVDGRYCRIIMRHNENDRGVFGLYDVPDQKHFHFLRNPGYSRKKELRDVYGVCTIGGTVFVVGFSRV